MGLLCVWRARARPRAAVARNLEFSDPALQTYNLKQITPQSCPTKPSDALPASTSLAQPTVARTRASPLTPSYNILYYFIYPRVVRGCPRELAAVKMCNGGGGDGEHESMKNPT